MGNNPNIQDSDSVNRRGTMGQRIDRFFEEVAAEFVRAHDKYPAPNPNTSALAGEAGEACEAMGKEPFENVYIECVQTAVMAMRLALEGDPYEDIYRQAHGLDLSSSAVQVNDIVRQALKSEKSQ